jgi:hypothetical protein
MSMKSWVLHRVQGINDLAGRPDLSPREPTVGPWRESGGAGGGVGAAGSASSGPTLSSAEHLGVYGPLIAAVRDELEHFVASHVRMHVAIADRDRFLLTSIGVRCPGGAEARDLLLQFMNEFKPEQVKRYLAREVIGGLANAAVIDLSQFAGLADTETRQAAADADEYGELLAALRSTPPAALAQRPYEVSVIGRWTEPDALRTVAADPRLAGAPRTPLAGQRCELDLEDRKGRRRAVLNGVVPGRRYSVGKDESCDIAVDGTYASRRHAEIWFERNAWHVADAGSTNGIRVETSAGVLGRRGPVVAGSEADAEAPIELVDGARIVLSARADGAAGDYPWLGIRPAPARDAARVTPIAVAAVAAPAGVPRTPLTSVLPQVAGEPMFELATDQADGGGRLVLRRAALPVAVGRSRNQALVIGRRHAGVSGHHIDIVEIDATGCRGVVHGDNGIDIDGVHHAPGASFTWQPGQALRLGASASEPPGCTLTLARCGGA